MTAWDANEYCRAVHASYAVLSADTGGRLLLLPARD